MAALWDPRASTSSRVWTAVLLGLCLITAVGCGSRCPKTAAVSGVVTYHGKPVEDACVLFIPKGNRSSSAKTDSLGVFHLEAVASDDGTGVGKHVVCVNKMKPDPKNDKNSLYPQMLSLLPSQYGTPINSPLKAAVTVLGPNEFRFDLVD